jgi:hypothetical protein
MHLAFLQKPGSIPVIKMINYCTEINKLLLELKASKVDVSVYENALEELYFKIYNYKDLYNKNKDYEMDKTLFQTFRSND